MALPMVDPVVSYRDGKGYSVERCSRLAEATYSRDGEITVHRRGCSPRFRFNVSDPLLRRTRTRPDHNRVRDVPSSVSLLGLAPPPPTGER